MLSVYLEKKKKLPDWAALWIGELVFVLKIPQNGLLNVKCVCLFIVLIDIEIYLRSCLRNV